jgi:pyridoxine/pyridoxamine 5'-phosphate oxidase
MDQLRELERIPAGIWAEFQRAIQRRKHAWRTPVLANISALGPQLRTLVLRKSDADRRSLRFYTDRRSAKWPALTRGDRFTALFYDPKQQWQVVAEGQPRLLEDALSDQVWRNLPVHGRAAYASVPHPGTPLETGGDGLPAGFFDFELPDTDYARANFAAFELVVESLEVLQLHREGHRRARFQWHSTASHWEGQWLVP